LGITLLATYIGEITESGSLDCLFLGRRVDRFSLAGNNDIFSGPLTSGQNSPWLKQRVASHTSARVCVPCWRHCVTVLEQNKTKTGETSVI